MIGTLLTALTVLGIATSAVSFVVGIACLDSYYTGLGKDDDRIIGMTLIVMAICITTIVLLL